MRPLLVAAALAAASHYSPFGITFKGAPRPKSPDADAQAKAQAKRDRRAAKALATQGRSK